MSKIRGKRGLDRDRWMSLGGNSGIRLRFEQLPRRGSQRQFIDIHLEFPVSKRRIRSQRNRRLVEQQPVGCRKCQLIYLQWSTANGENPVRSTGNRTLATSVPVLIGTSRSSQRVKLTGLRFTPAGCDTTHV